ncbi:penicillin-binding protein 1C [Thalassospira marina]|uniref:peptidoglycan glycosyltransferase n=1 Tax=Thalassospira marina TaxID=2048283 RepID=A0ABM6Q726_9PROT|nr:penicillin-binding protein 1C [Thalassospira marina]AUG51931.1 penicillin-binding protein 1C [Thalassospira marina]
MRGSPAPGKMGKLKAIATENRKATNLLAMLLGMGAVAVLSLWGLDRALPPNLTRLDHISAVVEGQNGQPLRMFSTEGGILRLQTRVDGVDAKYLRFLKSYEDRRFDSHWGVDPAALIRASWQWLCAGHIVSGGSTLTMQVARLLEPRDRTLVAKGIEILRALQLEWHYSKTDILNMYVTLAPFGGRIEGVRSAANVYFRKDPAHLTIAEAALLTVLPQSPSTLRPDRFPARARAARQKVLERLLGQKVITQADYDEAIAEPLPDRQFPVPMLAPHLAERLVAAYPGQDRITSTIEPWLQADIQKLVEYYGGRNMPQRSVALMVVENKTGKVRAHLGSRDYLDRASHGFVDMTQAVRSPGSTLKPFIYALSFEAHQTHPQTLIWDRAIADGGYRPANFDHGEAGEVSIADALRFSLNIPAVKVLERFGPIRFSETMRHNGLDLRLPHDGDVPNLAIALGGTGIRLDEMTQLYRALATDRKNCPLTYLQGETTQPCASRQELFSRQTQNWITGILQHTPRPAGYRAQAARSGGQGAVPIAFKTGTSYGYRDAWAFGYNADYTVGVWVGRASGEPVNGQTGLNSAAPLLFSVFEKLPPLSRSLPAASANDWQNPAPVGLKYFGVKHADPVLVAANALDIEFPADDSVFMASSLGPRGLVLRARNGERPLVWMVNGVPLPSDPWQRNVRWQPEEPGFYDITVLDKNGVARHRQVTIRANAPLVSPIRQISLTSSSTK